MLRYQSTAFLVLIKKYISLPIVHLSESLNDKVVHTVKYVQSRILILSIIWRNIVFQLPFQQRVYSERTYDINFLNDIYLMASQFFFGT